MRFREKGTAIRVLRAEPTKGSGKRGGKYNIVGEIPLATMVPPPELLETCDEHERKEIIAWIAQYRQITNVRDAASAFALQHAVDASVSYLRKTQSETERAILRDMMETAQKGLSRALRRDKSIEEDIDE